MSKIALPPEIREKFQEAGSRGGRATVERHGTDMFKRIGKQGGKISKRGPNKNKQRSIESTPETQPSD